MAGIKPESTDDYIASFPKEIQKILKQIRATIKKAAPGAEETISYAIPAFKLNGRMLIYFAGHTNHVGLYPAPRGIEAFKKELSQYAGGKGTVQFPFDKRMPLDLISRIVKFKVKENLEKTEKRNQSKK
ncbi:MAG TPA: DUF1801 domain-containing protein [Puia sp.]|nr:DUF1801 domain-containing protein [Puia sp.]